MKIIISPAKLMRHYENECFETSKPHFLDDANYLASILSKLNIDAIEQAFKCSRKIAINTYELFKDYNSSISLTPAILAYNGIQYLSMSPEVFTKDEINYVNNHLYILSGLYGALKPYDEIAMYRLDFEAKIKIDGYKNLFDFWHNKIYNYITKDDNVILNLASNEYRKLVATYLTPSVRFVDVFFYEQTKDKIKEKTVYVKEARGAMVRFLASINAKSIDDVTKFNLLNYRFSQELSNENKLVFIRKDEENVTD